MGSEDAIHSNGGGADFGVRRVIPLLPALAEVARHIFLLRRFEGVSGRLIAETLGCDVDAVERNCAVSLASLSSALGMGVGVCETSRTEAARWAWRIAASPLSSTDVATYEAWCAQDPAHWDLAGAMTRLWDELAECAEMWEMLRLRAGALFWLGGVSGRFGAGRLEPGR